MTVRTASCRCGQLTARCEGEPVRVSVCHCLDCQKRSGSAFAVQARWPAERIEIAGRFSVWRQHADSGSVISFRFCPECAATIAYEIDTWPGVVAVPVGAFADPGFPPPRFSVYEHRKHPWVEILGEDVDRSSSPSAVRRPGGTLRNS